MSHVQAFTDEQARVLVNLEQHYQVWIESERILAALPYDLRRKEVSGRSYLYEIHDRGGNGKSLGPWSDDNEGRFTAYHERKASAQARREASAPVLAETARLARALRVPMLASAAGQVLREADRRGLLDGRLRVIGTSALCAYALEASGFIRGAPDATEDFDMAWSAVTPETGGGVLWPMLKALDATFTVNAERTFQARNAKAYEIEFLVAPSRSATVSPLDQPIPLALPEQEWLLPGRTVDRVVVCRDGAPARIVAPDPRWFALQKLWMSRQAKRNPLKRGKDLKQGLALLDAVRTAMPHYPLDRTFATALPTELAEIFDDWSTRSGDEVVT